MLILRSAPPSPFVRKVRIAAAVLGLTDRIDVIDADTINPSDSLRAQNPLGKIPALILKDGTALYDSRVIAEYLDWLAGGGKILPPPGEARFRELTLQALADGIMDAAILQMYEIRFREADKHEPKWVDHQKGKVGRALAALEAAPPTGARGIGHISLACALGYLDLRFGGAWRGEYPKLVAWLAAFARDVPAFEATKMPVG